MIVANATRTPQLDGRRYDAAFARRLVSVARHHTTGNSSALHQIDGLTRNIYGNGVILPQGFAMMWADHTDRHVLQAGFDLGQHYTAGSGQLERIAGCGDDRANM